MTIPVWSYCKQRKYTNFFLKKLSYRRNSVISPSIKIAFGQDINIANRRKYEPDIGFPME